MTHEIGGTICFGHCFPHLVISPTKERGRWYVLLRVLGSASCDITHETGGTICHRNWVQHLVISHMRQGYDLLRTLGSASCGTTQETGGTILLRALGPASCDITHETGGMMLDVRKKRQTMLMILSVGSTFCPKPDGDDVEMLAFLPQTSSKCATISLMVVALRCLSGLMQLGKQAS